MGNWLEFCRSDGSAINKDCPDCVDKLVEWARTYQEERDDLKAEIARLKDVYESCEQCDGPTNSVALCVKCWNSANLQIGAIREAWDKGKWWFGRTIATMKASDECDEKRKAIQAAIDGTNESCTCLPKGAGYRPCRVHAQRNETDYSSIKPPKGGPSASRPCPTCQGVRMIAGCGGGRMCGTCGGTGRV